jgi:hypothetical protein
MNKGQLMLAFFVVDMVDYSLLEDEPDPAFLR